MSALAELVAIIERIVSDPEEQARIARMQARFDVRFMGPERKRFELLRQSATDLETLSEKSGAAETLLRVTCQLIVDPILLETVSEETTRELITCADELAMASRVLMDQLQPRFDAYVELLVRMNDAVCELVAPNTNEKES